MFGPMMDPTLIQSVLAYPSSACSTSTHEWLADALGQFYNFGSPSAFVAI